MRFNSWASSILSSHGAVTSTSTIFFFDEEVNMMSGLKFVEEISGGKTRRFSRSDCSRQSGAPSRSLFGLTRLPVLAVVSPDLTKLIA